MAAGARALLETLVMDGPPVAVWPNRADPRISGSSPHKQAGFMQVSVTSRFYIKLALKSRFIQVLVKHTGCQKVAKKSGFRFMASKSWHPKGNKSSITARPEKQSARPCKRTNRHLNILFARPNVTDCTQAADRKSTRLNSSHLGISYAVFCLKKK